MGTRTKLTYAEYRCIPDDGRRHEIIDGDHIVSPVPGTYHQTVSRRILFQLYEQIERAGLGQVFHAPTDVQLSDYDIVQPDLVVVLEASRRIVTPSKIKGTPELVVEILSEPTGVRDRTLKKVLYERSGVPEYWIVDPDEHLLEQYVLGKERYELAGKQTREVVSRGMPDVRVDLQEVW